MNHEKAVEIVHKLAAVNVGKLASDRIVSLVGEARRLVNPSEDVTTNMDHEKAEKFIKKLANLPTGFAVKRASNFADMVILEARLLVSPEGSNNATIDMFAAIESYVTKNQIAKTMDWIHEHYESGATVQVHDILDILRRIAYF